MEDDPVETKALLLRWFNGDREALNTLVERDLPWIRNRVRKRLGSFLRRKGETDDFVQEAMIDVLRYGPRFVVSDMGQFRALVARIVENVLRDQRDYFEAEKRKAGRERCLPADSVINLDARHRIIERPSQVAHRRERQELVRVALELLDEEDRDIIRLRQFGGKSFAEVSEVLGVSEDAARMRFNRALPRLAVRVKELRRGGLDTLLEDDS